MFYRTNVDDGFSIQAEDYVKNNEIDKLFKLIFSFAESSSEEIEKMVEIVKFFDSNMPTTLNAEITLEDISNYLANYCSNSHSGILSITLEWIILTCNDPQIFEYFIDKMIQNNLKLNAWGGIALILIGQEVSSLDSGITSTNEQFVGFFISQIRELSRYDKKYNYYCSLLALSKSPKLIENLWKVFDELISIPFIDRESSEDDQKLFDIIEIFKLNPTKDFARRGIEFLDTGYVNNESVGFIDSICEEILQLVAVISSKETIEFVYEMEKYRDNPHITDGRLIIEEISELDYLIRYSSWDVEEFLSYDLFEYLYHFLEEEDWWYIGRHALDRPYLKFDFDNAEESELVSTLVFSWMKGGVWLTNIHDVIALADIIDLETNFPYDVENEPWPRHITDYTNTGEGFSIFMFKF